MSDSVGPDISWARILFLFLVVAWPYFLNDFYLIYITRYSISLTVLWILDVIFYFLIPVTTLLILLGKNQLDHLKAYFVWPGFRPVLIAVILAFVLDLVMTRRVEPWILSGMDCKLCDGYSFPADQFWRMIVIVYAAVSAGVLEEVIFRGHLIGLLKTKLNNTILIILISSILFALIHWCLGPGKLVSTFVWGLILTIWFLKIKNLWPLIIVHALVDYLAFT